MWEEVGIGRLVLKIGGRWEVAQKIGRRWDWWDTDSQNVW